LGPFLNFGALVPFLNFGALNLNLNIEADVLVRTSSQESGRISG
jgi:hypothetical protein